MEYQLQIRSLIFFENKLYLYKNNHLYSTKSSLNFIANLSPVSSSKPYGKLQLYRTMSIGKLYPPFFVIFAHIRQLSSVGYKVIDNSGYRTKFTLPSASSSFAIRFRSSICKNKSREKVIVNFEFLLLSCYVPAQIRPLLHARKHHASKDNE